MWHIHKLPVCFGSCLVKFTELTEHLKLVKFFNHWLFHVFQTTSERKRSRPGKSRVITKKIINRQCFKCLAYFADHSSLEKHNPTCVFCPKCLRFRDYRHPTKCKGPPVYLQPRLFCTICVKSYSNDRIARHMAKAHNQPGPWLLKDHPEVITMVIVGYSENKLIFATKSVLVTATSPRNNDNKDT